MASTNEVMSKSVFLNLFLPTLFSSRDNPVLPIDLLVPGCALHPFKKISPPLAMTWGPTWRPYALWFRNTVLITGLSPGSQEENLAASPLQ